MKPEPLKLSILEGVAAEVVGNPREISEFLADYSGRTKSTKTQNNPDFSKIQSAKMFNLSDEDKRIVNFVNDYKKRHSINPTPKKILNGLGPPLSSKPVNWITRKLKGTLNRFLKRENETKGSPIYFTTDFLDDSIL